MPRKPPQEIIFIQEAARRFISQLVPSDRKEIMKRAYALTHSFSNGFNVYVHLMGASANHVRIEIRTGIQGVARYSMELDYWPSDKGWVCSNMSKEWGLKQRGLPLSV